MDRKRDLAAEPASKGYSGHAGAGEDAPFATQGEEETAKRVRNQLCLGEVCHFDRGCGCLTVIAAALRQRANEAREECVRIVYDEAHYEEETAKRIVAAIRARIAPP